MNKKLLSLFAGFLPVFGALAVLLPHPARAQTTVIPQKGYIITLAGDTVQGYIVPAPAVRLAQSCDFMLPRQVLVNHYLPSELRGYGTAVLTYESHLVPLSPKNSPIPTVPVFLDIVTRGPLTLYHLSTGEIPRFFLGGYRSGKLVELEHRTEKIYRNNHTFLVRQPLYQDTLARAFQSCPSLAQRVAQYNLNTTELKRVVQRFNSCGELDTIPYKPFRFGVVAGAGLVDRLTMGEGDKQAVLNHTYKGQTYFVGGVEGSFTPNLKGTPVTLRSGLLYEHRRTFTAEALTSARGKENVTLKLSYVLVPVMMRFSIGQGLVRPYGEIGGSFRLLAGVAQDAVRFASGPTAAKPDYPLLSDYKDFSAGLGAGAGLGLHLANGQQFSAGLRAERTSGPSNIGRGNGSALTTVSLLLSHTLSR